MSVRYTGRGLLSRPAAPLFRGSDLLEFGFKDKTRYSRAIPWKGYSRQHQAPYRTVLYFQKKGRAAGRREVDIPDEPPALALGLKSIGIPSRDFRDDYRRFRDRGSRANDGGIPARGDHDP